jgi:cell division protein FtsB
MHEVPFQVGTLNIVPGVSETGKSALLMIVDYCLGGKKHRVSKETPLESIGWYGLLLDIAGSSVFVARQRPEFGQKALDGAMLLQGQDSPPKPEEIRATTNIRAVIRHLGGMIGIGDAGRLSEGPQPGQGVRANLRHAAAYVFQPQRLIADPLHLFYGQSEAKAFHIRDTLPYFLGAVDTDFLSQRRDLQGRQRKLKAAQRQLQELEAPPRAVEERMELLVAEAREAGLIGKRELANEVDDRRILHAAVREPDPKMDGAATGTAAALAAVQSRRDSMVDQLGDLRLVRRSLLDHKGLAESYDDEAKQQRGRLTSLNLLPVSEHEEICPLCGSREADENPGIEDLRKELQRAEAQAANAASAPPQLESAIGDLDQQMEGLREDIKTADREITLLLADKRQSTPRPSAVHERSFLLGRIAGFLDEHPPVSTEKLATLKEKVEGLNGEVESLEKSLGTDAIRTRTENALGYVSEDMTAMARRLDLSYSQSEVRLDPVNLTVIGRDPRGPVHLNEEDIGGGKSWVGYHIVTLLSLHRHFVKQDRPVPRMLLLDQPTQAFYPSEKREKKDRNLDDLSDDDQAQVHRLFDLLRDTVEQLEGDLQLLVVDHAEFPEPWFLDAVDPNNWREGSALVPDDWFEIDT